MKTVLCNGCFDPLHYGHVLHLAYAQGFGDRLIVAMTRDSAVTREKGKGRPFLDETRRGTCLMMIKGVEDVFLCDNALEALKTLKPDVFVKGKDYAEGVGKEIEDYCKANGIEIKFTTTDKYSSTELIDELRRRSES